MTISTLESFNRALKDVYARPGERLKQWVVDTHRENEWESETCPRFQIPEHEDNTDEGTGMLCSSVGLTQWRYLDHHACSICGVLHRFTANDPRVVAWLAEKAKRPPIEADHSKLSDEIAPDLALADNPVFAMLRKR